MTDDTAEDTDGDAVPVHPDDDCVLAYTVSSLTIGASDDGMEVHLPPESAPIQSARVVELVTTTEQVEERLWPAGYDHHGAWHADEILELDRWGVALTAHQYPVVYAYTILFGDDVAERYYDDVRGHHTLGAEPIEITRDY